MLLVESNVIADGSMNGFINCLHYSRCKRLHVHFATAMEMLLFEEFCKIFLIYANQLNDYLRKEIYTTESWTTISLDTINTQIGDVL